MPLIIVFIHKLIIEAYEVLQVKTALARLIFEAKTYKVVLSNGIRPSLVFEK